MVPLVMALVCSVRAIPEETPSTRQSHNRGSFTNYVDTFLAFFDHLPTFIVDIVIRIKMICIIVDISSAPYLPRLVNIVCERPPSGNTARAPQSQSSSLDWLNPFTWFYRGDGERNNEEMKGGGGSSVINVQSQRKILRRRLGLVNIVRSY